MSPVPGSVYSAVAIVIVGFGLCRYGFHKGWSERDAEMQIEIAKKNDEAREIERTMTSKLNATTSQLLEANNVVDQKQSALDRAIRAGRVRLPAPSCVQATPSPSPAAVNQQAAAQPNGPTDANSDAERETLALIAKIAADGDRAINQLNACVDAYNQVREQINAQR